MPSCFKICLIFLGLYQGLLSPCFAAGPDGYNEPVGGVASCMHWLGKMGEIVRNWRVYTNKQNLLAWKLAASEKRNLVEERNVYVKLKDLFPNHNLDTTEAKAKTAERAAVLMKQKEAIKRDGVLSFNKQREFLPSNVTIWAISDSHGNLFAREGNGRLYALKEVFGEDSELLVEITYKDMGGAKETTDILERILELNGRTIGPRTSPVEMINVEDIGNRRSIASNGN